MHNLLISIMLLVLCFPLYASAAVCTPLGTLTPNFSLCQPQSGETGWSAAINNNWTIIDGTLTSSIPRSYLAGYQLSNDGVSPNTKIDITAGQAMDAGQAGAITLASSTIKDVSATFAAGSGNGCLGNTVTFSASTWYHVFAIKRTDTNAVDILCDTSVTAANIVSPYTLFRRIGSIRTDGSTHILAFTQFGDVFYWSSPVTDINNPSPGTSANTATLTVPPGVNVGVLMNLLQNAGTDLYISPLAVTDQAPSNSVAPLTTTFVSGTGSIAQATVWTNTNAQVRYRMSANNTIVGATLGWIDTRGRNN